VSDNEKVYEVELKGKKKEEQEYKSIFKRKVNISVKDTDSSK
jgi:hypothetical protein